MGRVRRVNHVARQLFRLRPAFYAPEKGLACIDSYHVPHEYVRNPEIARYYEGAVDHLSSARFWVSQSDQLRAVKLTAGQRIGVGYAAEPSLLPYEAMLWCLHCSAAVGADVTLRRSLGVEEWRVHRIDEGWLRALPARRLT